MTAKLLAHFKQAIGEFKLIPSDGGCFELTVNGKLLFSKLAEGCFPDEGKMLKAVEAKAGKAPVKG
ncbi:MAG: SelT/SelW/SelH family protein [Gemmataceae bacterium]|nr:SelT/SelW/SelH family protein [Gemmataceae bacterium]